MGHTKSIFRSKFNMLYFGLFFGLILVALPWGLNTYYLNLVIMAIFGAYLSQCWNVMSGYAGQFSFGHAVFFGLGAYTSTVLFVDFGVSPWVGMIIGSIVACLVGLLIGYLSFRYHLKGHYFALATLAFAEIFRVIFTNWPFVKGSMGILLPLTGKPTQMQFENKVYYYYLILIITVLLTGFLKYISKTRLGLYFIAIRENEDAADALGVDILHYKLIALGISAALTALAGTFYAQYFYYIDPHLVFGSEVSINAIIPAIIGGVGTVWGPIIGSLVLMPISELTRTLLADYSGMNLMVYGLILMIVIIYLPEGVMGFIQNHFPTKKHIDIELQTGKEDIESETPLN
ncbi:branched-chain amino acid ABC transporter permease [Desulfosporosinus sp. BICA1-9]|uniref:branched-chain amino acid ABC transporter permease n=1 Tax=Desulfosporosinus sp. BICA1-9 TaxID=1531958 RepID=UPI00054C2342|nr:branched-chain amino acid ABC transporter permease [Desulfosporosinus sp. BICA1-9]HBW38051.1 branched-chain amino acid ABC transporter permease [Desulfosporosinus sp.]